MASKVILFPVAACKQAILARHHIAIEVGASRYDMEVMILVTRLQPARADGGRSVRFLRMGLERKKKPAVFRCWDGARSDDKAGGRY